MKKLVFICSVIIGLAFVFTLPKANASMAEEFSMVESENCCKCLWGSNGCQVEEQCCISIHGAENCDTENCPYGPA